MNDLSLTVLPETAKDAQAIERLHERTFGPGRFLLSAYQLREHVEHLLDLSFTARIGTMLVGSTPVTTRPRCCWGHRRSSRRSASVAPAPRCRIARSRKPRQKGHRLVLLVGDETYCGRVGFKVVPKGRAIMPGPVEHNRLLVAELADGVSGAIRPDWSKAR